MLRYLLKCHLRVMQIQQVLMSRRPGKPCWVLATKAVQRLQQSVQGRKQGLHSQTWMLLKQGAARQGFIRYGLCSAQILGLPTKLPRACSVVPVIFDALHPDFFKNMRCKAICQHHVIKSELQGELVNAACPAQAHLDVFQPESLVDVICCQRSPFGMPHELLCLLQEA